MKVLCVGGGSMGRRRIRDLTYLELGQILLLEPNEHRCRQVAEAFEIAGFTRLEDALAEDPSVMTISIPPSRHVDYVRVAMDRNMHLFAEVPFVLSAADMREITERARSYPRVLGVSCTIRYWPPYRIIHDLLAKEAVGRPLYLEYSLGNNLAEWHPYEDYRTFYGSDVDQGGAGMDMIPHEVSPIQWWLGPIRSVFARFSKLSPLEIKGPDTHDVLLTFNSGCRGFFHDDVIEVGTLGRHVRVVGETGTIEWRQDESTVRLHEAGHADRRLPFSEAADWEQARQSAREIADVLGRLRVRSGHIPQAGEGTYPYEANYLREMKHFAQAVLGEREYTMSDIQEEHCTLRVLDAIRQSAEEHRDVPISHD